MVFLYSIWQTVEVNLVVFFLCLFFSCQFHTFESVEQQTDASEVTRLIHHVIGVSKKSSCFAQAVQSDVHLGCTDMTEKCFSFSDTALIHPPTNRRFFGFMLLALRRVLFYFSFSFFAPVTHSLQSSIQGFGVHARSEWAFGGWGSTTVSMICVHSEGNFCAFL